LDADAVQRIEPALNPVAGALLAKTSGIVCPFELTLAMAENAYENGAEFRFGEEVQQISPISGGYAVTTGNGTYEARIVVNAAGLYADRIHNMVCPDPITITPRRGEYFLLDKDCGNLVQRTIFQLPTKMGKGILVSPTAHGNLLIGPSAENIEDKENTATTSAGLASVRERAALSASDIHYNKVITSFTGLRAVGDTGDFIIGEAAEGFFDAAGIESPGLTSAPAIGEYLCELIGKRIDLTEKPDFKATRKGVTHFAQLSREAQNALIRENPAYGSIVCRCEQITEGEILDAIHRPLGATTLDGVKRRTRAGMGRCQAGFCTPRVMELLAEAQGIPLTDVRKR
ncbi:MAG: FAD-dependent oxidoreductase, partial [Oscillospiraceae bacterium]|nr:FAD-dependent oxidoreductase [Oscillospiraceae bacterium]